MHGYSVRRHLKQIQVSCERKARARNPSRRAAIRCTNKSHEDGEGTFTRQPDRLLIIRADQGDRTSPSPGSYHAASHLPWGSQLCMCFTHCVALVLISMTCRRLLLSIKTGIRCCRISGYQKYPRFSCRTGAATDNSVRLPSMCQVQPR